MTKTDERTIRLILASCELLAALFLFATDESIIDKLHNCDVMIREDVGFLLITCTSDDDGFSDHPG